MKGVTERQIFLQHLAQTSDFPLMLEIEKAEGVFMYGKDPDGESFSCIDLISGIGVSNLGHRHPKVVKAIQEQLEKYMHLMVYGEFVQTPQVRLAQKLASLLPNQLSNVYLVNSGSEAIEGALKLAKRVTGRVKIVSAYNSYHGSSHGALSVTGSEAFKNAFRPLLPGIQHIHFNAVEDLEKIDGDTAAVVLETIQGEAGVRVPTASYLREVRKRCKDVGALLILDEIQTGFGRTGKLWGFEHFDIVPDIVVMAKGMGGGMPIGAFASSPEFMGTFKNDPILGHISTFGGHPVSSAAALATVSEISDNKLYNNAIASEQLFHEYLVHPKIMGIRSIGLMMAVEFEDFETLKPIIDRAIKKGVLTDWFLFCDNSMRIAPPLIITPTEIQLACNRLIAAIEEK